MLLKKKKQLTETPQETKLGNSLTSSEERLSDIAIDI